MLPDKFLVQASSSVTRSTKRTPVRWSICAKCKAKQAIALIRRGRPCFVTEN